MSFADVFPTMSPGPCPINLEMLDVPNVKVSLQVRVVFISRLEIVVTCQLRGSVFPKGAAVCANEFDIAPDDGRALFAAQATRTEFVEPAGETLLKLHSPGLRPPLWSVRIISGQGNSKVSATTPRRSALRGARGVDARRDVIAFIDEFRGWYLTQFSRVVLRCFGIAAGAETDGRTHGSSFDHAMQMQ